MHIICLTPLEVGVYNDHKADHITTPPAGWAMIPEGFPLPSTFPRLGSIEAEEVTYPYEVEVEKEVVKTREVETFKEVVKTREIEVTNENGEPETITEEYTDLVPETVTEEYTEKVLVTEQREKVIMTVTAMSEGTLPDIPEPPYEPTPEERIAELEAKNAELEASIEMQAEVLDFLLMQ